MKFKLSSIYKKNVVVFFVFFWLSLIVKLKLQNNIILYITSYEASKIFLRVIKCTHKSLKGRVGLLQTSARSPSGLLQASSRPPPGLLQASSRPPPGLLQASSRSPRRKGALKIFSQSRWAG